jgi:hypothetical protein
MGAGRRQGEGVQDWAPVERPRAGQAEARLARRPPPGAASRRPARSGSPRPSSAHPAPQPGSSGGQPRSFSMTTRSSHTPSTDRPALDPEARLSDYLSDDRRTHPRTPADADGHLGPGPGWIRECALPRSGNLASGRRGRGFKSGHPDPGQRLFPTVGRGLFLCRTAAKYSNGYEPSCLPSRLSALSVLASETSV